MNTANPSQEMREWFAKHELGWTKQRITAQLRLPQQSDIAKAVTTLESPTHVGSLTVWGTGTIEFIVLDTKTKLEVVSRNSEYVTERELQQLLDNCAAEFERIAKESP